MGVAERDWHSDRQRRGGPGDFRPPERRAWNPVVVAIMLVALFLIGAKVDRWITERQTAAAATRSSERARFLNQPPAGTRPQLAQPVERDLPPAIAPRPAVRTVSKCIVNGQTTYSDNCSGSADQPVVVDAGDGRPALGLSAYQREMLRSADAEELEGIAACPRHLQTAAREPLAGSGRYDIEVDAKPRSEVAVCGRFLMCAVCEA